MALIEQSADYCTRASYDALSPEVRAHLRIRVLDSIGYAIGALKPSSNRRGSERSHNAPSMRWRARGPSLDLYPWSGRCLDHLGGEVVPIQREAKSRYEEIVASDSLAPPKLWSGALTPRLGHRQFSCSSERL
jgi:hypothetical protein